MAPDTDSQINEPQGLTLAWSRSWSLTVRILALNVFVLALLAGGLIFLDNYRVRLINERQMDAEKDVQLISATIADMPSATLPKYLINFGKLNKSRVRLYGKNGSLTWDSFNHSPATYELRDPNKEPWEKKAARSLDRIFDFLVGAKKLDIYREPKFDKVSSWPELNHNSNIPVSNAQLAPDLTYMVNAGIWTRDKKIAILATSEARDIRASVRSERFRIAMFFLFVLGIAISMSIFLGRTIVRPLKHLAQAAIKVRLGRAQEVTIPRLPSRRDEIGLLARALSDMSNALRQRIDATEAFAADVAHEIKNPLASLRSALDGIDNIKDPELRAQLMSVAKDDVHRMDRLISDISEASRVDSQLAKAKFELIDLGDMIEQLLLARENRNHDGDIEIAFARPRKGVAVILGEDVRIERVLNNLIDNAVSFSPPGGLIEISATSTDTEIIIRVIDEGPGVQPSEREAIFRRFHTERPTKEGFGKHSGLGLAIARTIIEGHEGQIKVQDRDDGKQGACFEIAIPSPAAMLKE